MEIDDLAAAADSQLIGFDGGLLMVSHPCTLTLWMFDMEGSVSKTVYVPAEGRQWDIHCLLSPTQAVSALAFIPFIIEAETMGELRCVSRYEYVAQMLDLAEWVYVDQESDPDILDSFDDGAPADDRRPS